MREALLTLACGTGALVGLALAAGTPAAAQEIPNLVGTWKGDARAVHIGPNPYRLPNGNEPTFGDNLVAFTYVVTQQEGTHFAGKTEGKFVETFIGGLKPPDYRSGIFIDDDGTYDFTLRDENTIDFCYHHLYPTSRVVSCFTITRQP